VKPPRTVIDDCLSRTGGWKDSVTRPELANVSINFGLNSQDVFMVQAQAAWRLHQIWPFCFY
jgi:hypothetical protein